MLPENWLVTVIIPVFNGERWISSTLASAAAQTHSMLEILVIDDGSTDGTAAIVEAAASRDDRIRLIRKQNGGVSAARNKGIAEARGELIAPLDADDLWHREKIARQVAAMRSPEVGLVYCWAVEIDENDRNHSPRLRGSNGDRQSPRRGRGKRGHHCQWGESLDQAVLPNGGRGLRSKRSAM